jgi:hypothetical protein
MNPKYDFFHRKNSFPPGETLQRKLNAMACFRELSTGTIYYLIGVVYKMPINVTRVASKFWATGQPQLHYASNAAHYVTIAFRAGMLLAERRRERQTSMFSTYQKVRILRKWLKKKNVADTDSIDDLIASFCVACASLNITSGEIVKEMEYMRLEDCNDTTVFTLYVLAEQTTIQTDRFCHDFVTSMARFLRERKKGEPHEKHQLYISATVGEEKG